MDAVEARRVLARYRALRARYDRHTEPLTVRKAADELRLPTTTLHNLVGQWHRQPRRLGKATRAKLDELLQQDVPTREICRRLAIGEGTVTRRRAALQAKPGTVVRCAKWRCPIGGELLQVAYCIEHQVPRPPAAAGDSNSPNSGAPG